MSVTVYDIAKQVGVSQPAVSQILNNKGRFAESTRDRVIRTAARLGYRPNAAARQVRSRRFNAAAVVARPTIGHTHHNIIKGLSRGLTKHAIHLMHAEIWLARGEHQRATPRLLRELCVDGLIINDEANVPEKLMDHVDRLNLPVVFVNMGVDHDAANPDDAAAAARLARAVLEAGHRRVGFIERKRSELHYSAGARHRGVHEALRSAGLESLVVSGADEMDSASRLLTERPEVTAWVCSDRRAALRLVIAAAALGLRVPQDVSIATFLNDAPTNDEVVRLTAMTNPLIAVGEAAADMLVRKIKDPTTHQPVEWVPWDDEPGQTLGPPRRA